MENYNFQKIVSTVAILSLTVATVTLLIFEVVSQSIVLSRNCTLPTRNPQILFQLLNGSLQQLAQQRPLDQ